MDALLPRGSFTSRSKLPVVYRGGLDAYSSGTASPAGRAWSQLRGRREPRLPSSKGQHVCSSGRSRLPEKRSTGGVPLRGGRAGRCPAAAGAGELFKTMTSEEDFKNWAGSAAALRPHSRPPDPFGGSPAPDQGVHRPSSVRARARLHRRAHRLAPPTKAQPFAPRPRRAFPYIMSHCWLVVIMWVVLVNPVTGATIVVVVIIWVCLVKFHEWWEEDRPDIIEDIKKMGRKEWGLKKDEEVHVVKGGFHYIASLFSVGGTTTSRSSSSV